MTCCYDTKGFLLLGNKTCDSHGNIKNISTILFNMYHSPLVLCLSSCIFCWFRDDLGTIQKLEIKPHQMAPQPNCVMNTLECLLGGLWKSIRTSNQKVVGSTPIRSTQFFFSEQPVSLTKFTSFSCIHIYHCT